MLNFFGSGGQREGQRRRSMPPSIDTPSIDVPQFYLHLNKAV